MSVFFNIFFFIAGGLLIYVAVHLRTKEKNKELVENVKKLEKDKKYLLSKFINEIEKGKKAHASVFKEKKFEYEVKRMQFSKYFTLLSTFHEKANILCSDKIDSLLKKLVSEDDRTKHKVIEKYYRDMQKLVSEIKEDQNNVKAEKNNILLMSSSEVDSLLDELNAAVESATEVSIKILTAIKTNDFLNNQSNIKAHQQNLFSHGQVIHNIYTAIKNQMKLELSKI